MKKASKTAIKILVIDDTEIHRNAAKAQLKGYDLTIAASFAEARELLQPEWPYEKDAIKFRPYPKEYKHPFEVVLTDLMMPINGHGDPDMPQDMPVGMYLAVLAALKGARRIGIISDMERHGPIPRDLLRPFAEEHFDQTLQIAGAKFTTFGYSTYTMRVRPDKLSKKVEFPLPYTREASEAYMRETIEVKAWASALKTLLSL